MRGRDSSEIAVMDEDGSELTEITTGDSIDEAASWVPGKDRLVLFQSAGVARDAAGCFIGLGPSEVQCLDVPVVRRATCGA